MRHNMRRVGLLLVLLVAQMAMSVPPALAAPPHPGENPKVGPKGKKNAIMYLTAKTPDPGKVNPNDWLPDTAGAWGKLRHNQSGQTFDFTFNGHGLQASTIYALVYKPEAWPDDNSAICLGANTSNAKGSLTIKSAANLGEDVTGAWLWLVLYSDIGWACYDNDIETTLNLTSYIYAYEGITFDHTQFEPQ